jgi:hypothetical protein
LRDLPNKSTSCHHLDDTVGNPSMSTSAPSWFCDVSTYGGEKLLNIEKFLVENSFKSKLKL